MKTSEKFEELTPEDNLLDLFFDGDLRLFTEASGPLEILNLGASPSEDYLVVVTKGSPPSLHWLDAKTWVASHSNNRLVKVKRERFVVISGHIPPGRDTLELLADTQLYGIQRVTTRLEQAEGWKTEALTIKKAWFSRIINLDDPTWVDTYTPIISE